MGNDCKALLFCYVASKDLNEIGPGDVSHHMIGP